MTKFEAIKAFCEKFQVPATIIKTGVKAEGDGVISRCWDLSGAWSEYRMPTPQVFTLAWDSEKSSFNIIAEPDASGIYEFRNNYGEPSYFGKKPKKIWQILKGYSDRCKPLFFMVINDWGKPEATYTLNEYPDLKEYLAQELEKIANQND
jgi:hypothetical protein